MSARPLVRPNGRRSIHRIDSNFRSRILTDNIAVLQIALMDGICDRLLIEGVARFAASRSTETPIIR